MEFFDKLGKKASEAYKITADKTGKIAKETKDTIGSYIVMGVIGIFFFHMVQNIGMTMGLLPITGVPLLLLSYGGSSLLTSVILIGLVLNIGARKS